MLGGAICSAEEANAARAAVDLEPVVSTSRLMELIRDSAVPLRILDARPASEYSAGHIPGAARLDVDGWKTASFEPDGLQNEAAWSQRIGALGIDPKTRVVVYGPPLPEAARGWWLLKYCGVTNAAVLDGGLSAWVAAGGDLETETREPVATDFPVALQHERLVEIEDLLMPHPTWLIIDNRSMDEFNGKVARGPRGGHMPGACSLDWTRFIDEDGKFKSREQLQKILLEEGLSAERPAVTHCQTGGRSSVGALVVEWVTGKPARNYYRSWSEYSAHPTAPVVK
jgi:thiosulfate/3-mercaptopyruvate sulfurtransferase